MPQNRSAEEYSDLFLPLQALSTEERQRRGYRAERLIKYLLEAEGLEPVGSFRNVGEQIDGAFSYQGRHFLVEIKWRGNPSGLDAIASLKLKVAGKLAGTLGIFISLNRYSKEALEQLPIGRALDVLLWDGQDIQAILRDDITFRGLLSEKLQAAARKGEIYLRASDVLPGRKNPRDMGAFLSLLKKELELLNPTSRYVNLARLFVAPAEYEEIEKLLSREYLAVITGDPHTGKTYTALHLAFRLFEQKGLRPNWITFDSLQYLFQESGYTIESFVAENLAADRVTVIEDPFGPNWPREIAGFTCGLPQLVQEAKLRQAMTILTTRDSIAEQVLKSEAESYLAANSRRIRLGRSYGVAELGRIARSYIELYQPKWATPDPDRTVQEVVEGLQAPHNIEIFLRATAAETRYQEAIRRLNAFKGVETELASWFASLDHADKVLLATTGLCYDSFRGLEDAQAMAVSLARRNEIEASKVHLELFLQRFRDVFTVTERKRVERGHQMVSWHFGVIHTSHPPIITYLEFRFCHPSYLAALRQSLATDPILRTTFEKLVTVFIERAYNQELDFVERTLLSYGLYRLIVDYAGFVPARLKAEFGRRFALNKDRRDRALFVFRLVQNMGNLDSFGYGLLQQAGRSAGGEVEKDFDMERSLVLEGIFWTYWALPPELQDWALKTVNAALDDPFWGVQDKLAYLCFEQFQHKWLDDPYSYTMAFSIPVPRALPIDIKAILETLGRGDNRILRTIAIGLYRVNEVGEQCAELHAALARSPDEVVRRALQGDYDPWDWV